jgi:hypothetical protein
MVAGSAYAITIVHPAAAFTIPAGLAILAIV